MNSLKQLLLTAFLLNLSLSYSQEIKQSLRLTNSDTQCFDGNQFCLVDTIFPKPGIPLKSAKFLFDDGELIMFDPVLNNIVVFCKIFKDPAGGGYGLLTEFIDTAGNISRQRFNKMFFVINCVGITSVDAHSPYKVNYSSDRNAASIPVYSGVKPVLYDLQGRSLDFEYELKAGELYIPLNGIPKGLYTIVLFEENTGNYFPLKLIIP